MINFCKEKRLIYISINLSILVILFHWNCVFMEYYHQEKNVEEYIRMAKGFDGQKIISELIKYFPLGSSVLELGMGPGTDLILLKQYYNPIGSDYSEIFIDRYRKKHPNTDLFVLNAVTLETDRKFQGIYSNKVLIHLTRDELKQSIIRQIDVLEPNGIICHSFWVGDREENYHGLRFVYYTVKQLRALFKDKFNIITIDKYQEIEPDDSVFLIARKK